MMKTRKIRLIGIFIGIGSRKIVNSVIAAYYTMIPPVKIIMCKKCHVNNNVRIDACTKCKRRMYKKVMCESCINRICHCQF